MCGKLPLVIVPDNILSETMLSENPFYGILPTKLVIDNFCANCKLYDWKQPEENALRKCGRCHVVAYCGKECQEEHWRKVHQKQCKYVGGTKKAKHSKHSKDICQICIMQGPVGDLVFKRNNPNYMCIFENDNWNHAQIDFDIWNILPPTYPHPFPLKSPPEDRIERMLTVAQKLLLKMKVTQNPAWYLGYDEADKLEDGFWNLRSELYLDRIIGCNRDPRSVLALFKSTFNDSFEALTKKTLAYTIKEEYQLWATFALMISLMYDTAFLGVENALKSPNSLPRGQRQMSKGDFFFEVADKIIEALDQQLVPHSDLAAIVCGGKTDQNCSHCHKEITISGIFHRHVNKTTAEVVFNPVQNGVRYVCEASECRDKEKGREFEETTCWNFAVMATFERLYGTRCDYCFLLAPFVDVHRSKCRTKNYCSQVCSDSDTAVHKVCCNPDKELRRVDERKVKIGGKDKREAANARVDSFVENIESTEVPELDKKIEKLSIKTKKEVKTQGQNQIDEVD